MNTRIDYLYRDGDNYKFPQSEVLAGEISADQIRQIIDTLDEGEYFIPGQVGFNCGYAFGYAQNDSDHPWCEMDECGFELTSEEPTLDLTVEEVVASFLRAKGNWDDNRA